MAESSRCGCLCIVLSSFANYSNVTTFQAETKTWRVWPDRIFPTVWFTRLGSHTLSPYKYKIVFGPTPSHDIAGIPYAAFPGRAGMGTRLQLRPQAVASFATSAGWLFTSDCSPAAGLCATSCTGWYDGFPWCSSWAIVCTSTS